MSHNHVRKIAIVGPSFAITAITRAGAATPLALPDGVRAAEVDYDDRASLVRALAGHDVLVVTLAAAAPEGTQERLVEAAAEARVGYILPNFWGVDTAEYVTPTYSPSLWPTGAAEDMEKGKALLTSSPAPSDQLSADVLLGLRQRAACRLVSDLGASAWVGVVTSFWYEMSLASPWAFGMDYEARKWTFYDDGETRINVITLPQSGRAVANLLSLPIESETGPSLSGFKNGLVYAASFCVSQRDMFESVLRVTGTTASDWSIIYESSAQRFADGQKQMADGDMAGFGKLLYSRVFFKDGSGNFEARRGLHNDVLGLEEEELDDFTKIAIARIELGSTYP
ncbi:hypothetical protein LQW54_005769 [Pestalotiopsis sp. IQ-011]